MVQASLLFVVKTALEVMACQVPRVTELEQVALPVLLTICHWIPKAKPWGLVPSARKRRHPAPPFPRQVVVKTTVVVVWPVTLLGDTASYCASVGAGTGGEADETVTSVCALAARA